jgi:transposase
MLLVYRYHIKSLTGLLKSHARACNFVWNFCDDTQLQALKWNKRWPSGFDLNRLTAESSNELFRHMLRYKATALGAWYEEVNESFSSRVCSSCASETGPKGVADLGIRSWTCSEWGVAHDRDINSARNILFRSGHRTPAEGIPVL